MTLLGIGFVLLCYYWGKAELDAQRTKSHLALLAFLPQEERASRAREILDRAGKK